MSVGLPVLASTKASLPEIGADAVRFIPPDNPAGLAAAMLALEADPDNYAQRAEAAFERGKNFSWGKTAKTVLEFLERL